MSGETITTPRDILTACFPWLIGVALLVLGLSMAACAGPVLPTATPSGPAAAGAQSSSATFTEEDAGHAVVLAKMRGHLLISWLLWKAGKYELAATHAQHPVEELFPTVADELGMENANALKSALDGYGVLAGKAGDAQVVEAAHQTALDAIDAAGQALAGSWLDDPPFQGEVIRELLEGVEEEYAEAVVGQGQVIEIEYQDALGFLTVAKERYATIEATVEARYPSGHEEIEEEFAALEKALPGVTPPAQVVDPAELEDAVQEIAAELSEALGLGEAVAKTPAELIAEIRDKTSRALEEYEEGKTDEAYELAASAYLDGFEHIEGDLLQKGERELMETIELQFKDLRDGIRAKKPLEDLRTLAAAIEENLDRVETLLK